MHSSNNIIPWPTVIERDPRGIDYKYDIYSRLLKDRIIMLGTPINDDVANMVIAQLLFLQMDDPKKDIHLYVNSPGGHITAGMAIYDTMQFMTCDVATYCMGQAASMGAVLLAAGTKGKRYALPNARVMIHQPHGGGRGMASDIAIVAKEILRAKKRMIEIFVECTGQTEDRITADLDRDSYMSALDAKTYGIVDEVVAPRRGGPPPA